MEKKRLFKATLAFLIFMMAAAKTPPQNGLMYRAALAEVRESVFYKVTLSPHALARCQCSLADLRIINTGKQVPYIIS